MIHQPNKTTMNEQIKTPITDGAEYDTNDGTPEGKCMVVPSKVSRKLERELSAKQSRLDSLLTVVGKMEKLDKEYETAQCALGLRRMMEDDPTDKDALESAKNMPSMPEIFKWIQKAKQGKRDALAQLEQWRKENK